MAKRSLIVERDQRSRDDDGDDEVMRKSKVEQQLSDKVTGGDPANKTS